MLRNSHFYSYKLDNVWASNFCLFAEYWVIVFKQQILGFIHQIKIIS